MHLNYVLDWSFLIKSNQQNDLQYSQTLEVLLQDAYTIAATERCSFKIAFPENSYFCCQYFRNTNFKEHLLVAASKYSFENIFTMNDLRAILR